MSIARRETLREELYRLGKIREYAKLLTQTRLTGESSEGTVQHVTDFHDFAYFGNITLGDPQQQFLVVLDTGEFWGTSLCVKNQTFGQATMLASFFARQSIDGILGLGFPLRTADAALPPFINAVQQGLVEKPIFTVYLEHHGPGSYPNGGIFTYGGEDPENCGDVIKWQPLTRAAYWQFKLDGIEVKNVHFRDNWEAISDTGSSFIGGPAIIIEKIAATFGAVYDEESDGFIVNCKNLDKISPLTFVIGGEKLPVQPVNLVAKPSKDECELTLFAFDSMSFSPSFILGTPMIRQYCTVYDVAQKRLGFAPSKQKDA